MPRANKKKKDPNAPKGPLTAYMLFCGDYREKVKRDNPNISFGQVGKELGRLWKEADAAEKDKYEQLAQQDKMRYKRDMETYQESKALTSSEEEEVQTPKSKKRKKDPNAPKGALSAYMIFSREIRTQVKDQFPEASFGEIGKHIRERWRNMSEEEKQKYNDAAEEDKKRYANQMSNYAAQQKLAAELSSSSSSSGSSSSSESESASGSNSESEESGSDDNSDDNSYQ